MGKLKVTPKRIANISAQLLAIIKLICEVRGYDYDAVISKFTNITEEEFEYIYSCRESIKPDKNNWILTKDYEGGLLWHMSSKRKTMANKESTSS